MLFIGIAGWAWFSYSNSERGFVNHDVRHSHVYRSPERTIDRIKLNIFYAVPQDKRGLLKTNWSESIAKDLEDIVKFHAVQFRGFSQLREKIYATPILLDHESSFYDSEKTDGGNPHALVAVSEEIEKRVFRSGGDLYDADLAARTEGEYVVMGIVYEGVGASGGLIYDSPLTSASDIAAKIGVSESLVHIVDVTSAEGFFLVHSNELGASTIYHEFAHAIGIADHYEGGEDFSEDIMGLGRQGAIRDTYIDRETLRDMGVL